MMMIVWMMMKSMFRKTMVIIIRVVRTFHLSTTKEQMLHKEKHLR